MPTTTEYDTEGLYGLVKVDDGLEFFYERLNKAGDDGTQIEEDETAIHVYTKDLHFLIPKTP